eukprot:gene15496-15641_t
MFGFLLTSLMLELTPGPNMSYLAALALARGRGPALQAVAGVALGLALVGAAAAVGLAELLAKSPYTYTALRYSGIFYMVWLAWDAWRASSGATSASSEDFSSFRRGLLVNVLNPKAAFFYVSVLPGFINVESGHILRQNFILVGIYVLVACFVHVAIVIFAVQFRRTLMSSENGRRLVGRGLALALLGVAGWMAWDTRV